MFVAKSGLISRLIGNAQEAAPPAASLPSWVSALDVGEWYQIPDTTLADSFPDGADAAVVAIDAYNGAAVDTSRSRYYLIAASGHGDGAWNGAVYLNLNTASPAWATAFEGSASYSPTSSAYYSDGRPCGRHTYYMHVYRPQNDRVMMVGNGARAGDGYTSPEVDGFNIVSGDFDAADTYPDVPSAINYSSNIALCDTATGDIYLNFTISGDRAFYRLRYATGVWSWTEMAQPPYNIYGSEVAGCVDTTRNQVVLLDAASALAGVYSISGNSWSSTARSGLTASSGAVYVPAIDKILYRTVSGGGNVSQIDPDTFAMSSFSTTGGSSVASRPYVYNSFAYVPDLQGCIYVPDANEDAWFLRVH